MKQKQLFSKNRRYLLKSSSFLSRQLPPEFMFRGPIALARHAQFCAVPSPPLPSCFRFRSAAALTSAPSAGTPPHKCRPTAPSTKFPLHQRSSGGHREPGCSREPFAGCPPEMTEEEFFTVRPRVTNIRFGRGTLETKFISYA